MASNIFPRKPTRSQLLSILLFCVGLILLIRLLTEVGLWASLERLKSLGWMSVFLLGVTGLAHLIKVWAWSLAFEKKERTVGLVHLWLIRLAGESLSYMSSAGMFLGDPVKVSLLGNSGRLVSISSVVMDRAVYIFSLALFLLGGLLAHLFAFGGGSLLKVFVPAVLGVAFVVIMMVWAIRREVRVLSAALKLPFANGSARLARGREKVRQLEDYIFTFQRQNPSRFPLMVFLNLLAQFLIVAEIRWIFLAMEVPSDWFRCFMLATSTKAISLAFFFIPVQIGVFEGGNLLFADLLDFPENVGVAMALARRLFDLAWAIVGLAALALLFFKWPRASLSTTSSEGNEALEPQK
ncbi:MAG: flippase-like domain-containing protein [Acidobacteria bacterium]|nr:flippase-like domain-containing protein [Acidobacteriota bacterium]